VNRTDLERHLRSRRNSNGLKIADFGISKRMNNPVTGYTFQGAHTAPWAPPEQIHGAAAHPSADIYAWGRVVVFLLTGRTAVDVVADVPIAWRELLTACTSLVPERRAQPQDEQSVLDVSASWATTLPPKIPIPTKVRIKHEYFPIIQDISRKLRPALAPTADLFVGYIANLGGQPGEDGRMQGEATLSIVYEEQIQSVRVDLRPEWWGIAHAALGTHGIVRFRGVFHRGARIHRITNITEFAPVQ
jgi:serine/threonine protein kinase